MAALWFRQSVWDAATPVQRKVARYAARTVDLAALLATPLYQTAGGVRGYLFDSAGIGLDDVAYFSTLAALIAQLPTGSIDNPNPAVVRARLRAWLASRVNWPLTYTDTDDPYQVVLAANNAPAWLRAAGGVPAGLTPVDV